MRPASGCKLFGAYQALGGIQDGVVLLHSVVGCNFGSMSLHVAQDMRDIRQTCTVISDSDVVFSGEASLERAVRSALELFQPSVLFVVSGCVSEMIGDDIPAVLARIPHEAPLLHVEAAGFRGDAARGLEAGWLALLPLMKPPVPWPYPRPYPRSDPRPMVNLIGLGMDDPHAADDVEALRAMLAPQAALGAVLSRCTLEEVRRAPYADVNLVLRGKGRELAQAMKEYFGIPWEELDYPYGAAGADDLWSRLERRFGLDYHQARAELDRQIAEGAGKAYRYLQALYGMPAAILASGPRADGLRRFLEQELGMEVVCFARREELSDQEDFYRELRGSEAALLFGSSFEQDGADELEIPLIRVDYPVFDEVCLTPRPHLGGLGTLHLLEDIFRGIMNGRILKGALYQ